MTPEELAVLKGLVAAEERRISSPEESASDLQRKMVELAKLTELMRHLSLVSIHRAAQHMGISVRTLRRLVAGGEVVYKRVGGSLRFNLALLGPRRCG